MLLREEKDIVSSGTLYYGTAIAFEGVGFLVRGPSGSGKSDLALRLLMQGGVLIADDQTLVYRQDDQLLAQCPEPLKNKLEVRGVGIVFIPTVEKHPLHALIKLQSWDLIERLPDPCFETLGGVSLPSYAIDPWSLSAVDKLKILAGLLKSL